MSVEHFDRELSLGELLPPASQERLHSALQGLLGVGVWLCDGQDEVILSAPGPMPEQRLAIAVELEPIAYLHADAPPSQLEGAAELLRLVLLANARYVMASDLHLEAVHEDYATLAQEHKALLASEQRYRELAAHLEQRVAEQVAMIEHTQRQLYQSGKLASVGRLAAGVAHEINNPIGYVNSNLGTAIDYLERMRSLGQQVVCSSDSALREFWQRQGMDALLVDFAELLAESREGVARVARVVSALKGFSSIDSPDSGEADVNAVIRQSLEVARGTMAAQAQVALELGVVSAVKADPARLGEVVLNLLLNAVAAVTPGEGRIRISTSQQEQTVHVQICDNGCGISQAEQEKIFEPFYTTHGVGEGSGLGLTVANDIIKGLGGRIELDSRPGDGSCFTILLPG